MKANVFFAYGTLEKEKDIQGFKNFINMLENINDGNLTVEHVVIEGFDHRAAEPMAAVRSMYWLSDLIKAL